jgi:uncharacterized protein
MHTIKRHPLVLFFFLAFLFPWLVWGTTIAQARGLLSFHIPQPLAFWIGLTLATYLSAWLSGGWPAVKDLLARLIRWNVQPFWYLVALLSTGALGLVAIFAHRLFGGSHQVGVLLSAQDLLPSLLFQLFFFLITEETAWRGFALPRLQTLYSPLASSLILGVLWGLWHLPLVWIAGSFQSQVPFAGFILAAVATTILITWVFNHSKGSVLVAALFHAATDTTIAYANVMTGDKRLFWIFIFVQCLAAAGVLFAQGSAYLARKVDLRGTTFPSTGN